MRAARSWSEDELLEELRGWLASAAHPSGTAYEKTQRSSPDMPSLSTICRRFGSWQLALEEVGHVREPNVFPRYADAEILEALQEWIRAGGDGRAETYSKVARSAHLPSYNTVFQRFGSWRAALNAIGEQPRSRRWAHDDVLSAVARWFDSADQFTSSAYALAASRSSELPCLPTVTAKLGSWSQILSLVNERRQRSGVVGSG